MRGRGGLAIAVGLAILVLLGWWIVRDSGDAGDGAGAAATGAGQTGSLGRRGVGVPPVARRSGLRWFRPVGAIAGTVRDDAGKPVAGASVCAWAQGFDLPSAFERDPRCADSARNGAYRIEELPPLRYQVGATAPHHVPGEFRDEAGRNSVQLGPGLERTGVDIIVRSGGVPAKGVVYDVAGGVVAGAWVRATQRWGIAAARADASGAFTLWVEAGELWVQATAEGYAKSERSTVAPGHTVELFLTPESVLVGRVVTAAGGSPVADALVRAGGDALGEGVAYTDEEGRFRIEGLKPGRFKPWAESGQGWGQIEKSVHLGLAETSNPVVIKVHATATVRGRVVVDGGEPCLDGAVMLLDRVQSLSHRKEADGEGVVEIHGVFAGTYGVEVTCDGFAPLARYDDIVVGAEPLADHEWPVQRGQRIEGTVVDANGDAVPGATVMAQTAEADAHAKRLHLAGPPTNADGAFSIGGAVPGVYALHVSAKGYPQPATPLEVTVSAGRDPDDVQLVLVVPGEVRGRVVDGDGGGVAGIVVRASGPTKGGGKARTTDDGAFEMTGLVPGDYRVRAFRDASAQLRAPGSGDDDVQGTVVRVVAGEAAEVELVVEGQTGTIAGRVVDDGGGAVADAFINYSRESESSAATAGTSARFVRWGGWERRPVLTDQDGTFALTALSPGRYTVQAYRKGGGEGVVEHVDVGATGVVISLQPESSISGVVKIAGGDAPERFTIEAREKTVGFFRSEQFVRTQGRWQLRKLPAGSYELTVKSSEGDAVQGVEVADGQDRSGIVVELAPRVTVRGTVVDFDSGDPVPGVAIAIAPGRQFSWNFGAPDESTSNEDGEFVVANAPSGNVLVSAIPHDRKRYEWTSRPATISADSDEVTLAPVRLVRRRIAPGERAGDLGFRVKQAPPGVDWQDTPLVVAFIRPGGPAAKAGLRVGDVIVSIDGRKVTGANRSLYPQLVGVRPGTKLTLGRKGAGAVTLIVAKAS